MTTVISKFTTQLPELRSALDEEVDLRSNRKLYKKLYKFYKDQGVIMTGDSDTDYSIILELLYEDVA